MYRNTFQDGSYVEVFNPVNKDLISRWLIAKNIKKEYDKIGKTYVYVLKGGTTAQPMVLPKDKKSYLGLTQHHLVLQVYFSHEDRFSMEVRIACCSGCHKRISLVTHRREMQITPLSAFVPFEMPPKFVWVHLCVNLADLCSELWNEDFKRIDSLSLSGNFRMRKIYTIHESCLFNEKDPTVWHKQYLRSIPKSCHFPVNVEQCFHLVANAISSSRLIGDTNGIAKITWIPSMELKPIRRQRKNSVGSGSGISMQSAPANIASMTPSPRRNVRPRSARTSVSSTTRSTPETFRVKITSEHPSVTQMNSAGDARLYASNHENVSQSIMHKPGCKNVLKRSQNARIANIGENFSNHSRTNLLPQYKHKVTSSEYTSVSDDESASQYIMHEPTCETISKRLQNTAITNISEKYIERRSNSNVLPQSRNKDIWIPPFPSSASTSTETSTKEAFERECNLRVTSASDRMQEGRGIADILPRYKQRTWKTPLSPVSNALSLSRAIVKEHTRQKEDEHVRSVTDILKDYCSEHQNTAESNQSSPELINLEEPVNTEAHDLDSLCDLHRQQYQNNAAMSSHSLVGGLNKNHFSHVPKLIHTVVDSQCNHSRSDLNSTYTLDSRQDRGDFVHCHSKDNNENSSHVSRFIPSADERCKHSRSDLNYNYALGDFVHCHSKEDDELPTSSSHNLCERHRPPSSHLLSSYSVGGLFEHYPPDEDSQPDRLDMQYTQEPREPIEAEFNSTYTLSQFNYISDRDGNLSSDSSMNPDL